MRTEHEEWQRKTALAKIERDRAANEASKTPVAEEQLILSAARYVGAPADKVRGWVRGR